MIYLTSSWDDGSKFDMKLSELLLKYNQSATFYVPFANSNPHGILDTQDIYDISKSFEIGAHTINHKYLTKITNNEAEYEITKSKTELEEITGRTVYGFCFPGGKFKRIHVNYAILAGYKYVRTVNMFKLNYSPIMMDTTLQVYDHSILTYAIHLIKRGYFPELLKFSFPILQNKQWDILFSSILETTIKNDLPSKNTIIHLWGHSWEIQDYNMWKRLECIFQKTNDLNIPSKTNYEITQL